MYDYPSTAVATEHIRALRLAACREHLVRLATCCQPGALRRQSRAAVAWLRTGRTSAATGSPAES
jgi:hypothetical protein